MISKKSQKFKTMLIKKRTFEASSFPKGSEERNRLNLNALTSEYMTSMKYVIVLDNGRLHHTSFKTKTEAELAIPILEKLKN